MRRNMAFRLGLMSFLLLATVASAQEAKKSGMTKVEYTLKTPRSREPVLGGLKDKAFVSVWIPEGVKTVRGGMCNPFSKGDSVSEHWQAMCRHWKFAYVQTDFDAVKREEYELLKKGLADLAVQTGHPELEHLPLCFTGMSRGGGMSMQLSELTPERTIASVPVCLEVGPGSEATRRIPVLTVFGERDGSQMAKLLARLPGEREQGARWSIAVQWGRGHEFARANNLSFIFLDDVIARRLPKEPSIKGPTKLSDLPLEDGWIGDQGTWGKDGKRPTIQPYKEFKGDKSKACWLPSQRSATAWQAFVAGTNDLVIEQPAGLGDKQKFVVQPAGKPIPVRVAVSPRLKPAKLELWDGEKRLAQRTEAPWTFEVTLSPGVHSLYVTAEDSGQVRSSRPNTIVAE